MKKRLLIGTLILTIFLVGLIPASVGGITGSGFSGFTINGRGTASSSEVDAKFVATIFLKVTDRTVGTIEGVGKGQLTTQGFTIDVMAGNENVVKEISFMIRWSFDRIDKTLDVVGIIGEAGDNNLLFLSGTLVGNTDVRFKLPVKLSGWLSWDTEIVSLDFVGFGSIIGDNLDTILP